MLADLDSTIEEVRKKVSEHPDPFLVEVLTKLEAVRDNKQERLEEKAGARRPLGGFKGYGVS